MNYVDELDRVEVRQTGIGTGYVLLDDIPAPSREALWQHLGTVRAKLIIDGVGRAVYLHDWLGWVELQREAANESPRPPG